MARNSWLVMFVVLLLNACASAPPGPPASPQGLTPIDGGKVIARLLGSSFNHFDMLDTTHGSTYILDSHYATLVATDGDGKPIPYLAESWKDVTPTGITFTLKKDITCPDGTKVTPTVVKDSLQAVISSPVSKVQAWGPGPYSVTADDAAGTVTFKTQAPYGELLLGFANAQQGKFTGIICPAGLAPGADRKTKMYGIGPYLLEEVVPRDHVTMKLRPDFKWGPAGLTAQTKGMPETITFQIVASESTAANLLITGGLDYGYVTGPDVERLIGAGIQHKASVSYDASYVFFNQAAGHPTADPKIRQALITALDAKAIIKSGYNGRAEPTSTGLSTKHACYSQDAAKLAPTPSVEKAREVLVADGWAFSGGKLTKNGQPLTVSLLGETRQGAAPDYIQSQWTQMGATVKTKVVDLAGLGDVWRSGDFDASMVTWGNPSPTGNSNGAFISGTPYPQGSNYARSTDQVLNQARTAAQATLGAESCKSWAAWQEQLWKGWHILPVFAQEYHWFGRGIDVSQALGNTLMAYQVRRVAK